MATPINFVLPDSGPFRFIHEQFRNNKRFAEEVRNGGAIFVLSMTKPIIKVKVAKDGKTLFADEQGLYEDWLYCCPGQRLSQNVRTDNHIQTNQKVNLCPNQS